MASEALPLDTGPGQAFRPPQGSARLSSLASVLILLICVLVTRPFAEMGINDDWSYIRTAQLLAQTGHIVFNGWGAPLLGWQLYLGALFIKLFGFSFTIARTSILLISLCGTYLLHRVMLRFGLSAANATWGTLVIVLSPIFLPIVFSFMSDAASFFCLVLCVYACQRAVTAESARAAIAWLCFAGCSNIVGGTVRQIAWLGVLVVVPSAAWLLRKRKGALVSGALLWGAGLVFIYLCTRWFSRQAYSIPEETVRRAVDRQVVMRLLHSLADGGMSLVLLASPILIGFLPRLLALPKPKLRIAVGVMIGVLLATASYGLLLLKNGRSIEMLVMPWLGNMMTPRGVLRYANLVGIEPVVLPLWLRSIWTLCSVATGMSCILYMVFRERPGKPATGPGDTESLSWRQMLWLLMPFFAAYFVLLLPRATFRLMVDRYLTPLLFVIVIVALRYLQEQPADRRLARFGTMLSATALLPLLAFGVAGTHDVFALSRARLAAADQLLHAGVPQTAIEGGMEYDAWTQVTTWGYIDEPHLANPAGAYKPHPVPQDPCHNWFLFMAPAVTPQYVLAYDPVTCYTPSEFAPVAYTTWLPPYGQKVYVQRVSP